MPFTADDELSVPSLLHHATVGCLDYHLPVLPISKTILREIFPLSFARIRGRGKGLVVPGDGEVWLAAALAKPANSCAYRREEK